MQRLIIVESPSKAKTLARFLGSEYIVLASMGHVRDLPKSKIGVDVESGFVPQYEVVKGKEKQLRDLKAAAKKATSTLLAADPDREGEAIAWHLAEALGLRDPDRIVFHEITKLAVDAALAHPRKIDRSLVAAQEARRVIDRLVGYRLSPLLWRKVRAGTSAGRVQSVAVRLVVDREAEIDAFEPVESWTIEALLAKDDSNPFTARLVGRRGDADAPEREKLELGTQAEAAEVIAALGLDDDGAVTARTPAFVVRSIDVKERSSLPLPATYDKHAAAGRELAARHAATADDERRAAAVRGRRARDRRDRPGSSPTCAPTRCASAISRRMPRGSTSRRNTARSSSGAAPCAARRPGSTCRTHTRRSARPTSIARRTR